jgi:hypothetical protein
MIRVAALGALALVPACVATTPYDLRFYPPRSSVYVAPSVYATPPLRVYPGPRYYGPSYRPPGGFYYGRPYNYGRPYTRPYYYRR